MPEKMLALRSTLNAGKKGNAEEGLLNQTPFFLSPSLHLQTGTNSLGRSGTPLSSLFIFQKAESLKRLAGETVINCRVLFQAHLYSIMLLL